MKRLFLVSATLLIFGCAEPPSPERSRTNVGKADSVGTCEGACGDISAAGDCYCDELCAEYGDCCADVAETCELSECSTELDTCGPGAWCQPGICYFYCPVGDDSCCSPSTCQPVPCPSIAMPGPDFCDDNEEIVPVKDDADHCVIGFECQATACCSNDDYPEQAFEPVECCENGTWQMTGSGNPCGDLGMEEGSVCADPIHPGICGDGTQALCTVIPEPCPAGQTREIVNHCYGQCVNPVSCLPPPTPL